MALGTFANWRPSQFSGFNTSSVHQGARNMLQSRALDQRDRAQDMEEQAAMRAEERWESEKALLEEGRSNREAYGKAQTFLRELGREAGSGIEHDAFNPASQDTGLHGFGGSMIMGDALSRHPAGNAALGQPPAGLASDDEMRQFDLMLQEITDEKMLTRLTEGWQGLMDQREEQRAQARSQRFINRGTKEGWFDEGQAEAIQNGLATGEITWKDVNGMMTKQARHNAVEESWDWYAKENERRVGSGEPPLTQQQLFQMFLVKLQHADPESYPINQFVDDYMNVGKHDPNSAKQEQARRIQQQQDKYADDIRQEADRLRRSYDDRRVAPDDADLYFRATNNVRRSRGMPPITLDGSPRTIDEQMRTKGGGKGKGKRRTLEAEIEGDDVGRVVSEMKSAGDRAARKKILGGLSDEMKRRVLEALGAE